MHELQTANRLERPWGGVGGGGGSCNGGKITLHRKFTEKYGGGGRISRQRHSDIPSLEDVIILHTHTSEVHRKYEGSQTLVNSCLISIRVRSAHVHVHEHLEPN